MQADGVLEPLGLLAGVVNRVRMPIQGSTLQLSSTRELVLQRNQPSHLD